MKKILLFFAVFAASQFSQAASSDCAVLNKTADRNGAVYSPVLGKKVMKQGRLYPLILLAKCRRPLLSRGMMSSLIKTITATIM